jgi:hypothetical protein
MGTVKRARWSAYFSEDGGRSNIEFFQNVSFEDVTGVNQAMGCLLVYLPGTGKTQLVCAVTGEARPLYPCVTRVLLSVTVTADRVWSGIHIAETENMVSNRTDRDFNYH